MAKVITFSRTFPSYHPKAGQPTHFVEAMMNSLYPFLPAPKEAVKLYEGYLKLHGPYAHSYLGETIVGTKHHTIRAGHRWKVGDKFSPRVWSGKPYNSKQITIAPDIQIKKLWDFDIEGSDCFIDGRRDYVGNGWDLNEVAKNDGLSLPDMLDWFQFSKKDFHGQIICHNENIEY